LRVFFHQSAEPRSQRSSSPSVVTTICGPLSPLLKRSPSSMSKPTSLRHREFLRFLKLIDQQTPGADGVLRSTAAPRGILDTR
jgi:hypothetical protein